MSVWIPGVLALVGSVAGVVTANALSRRTNTAAARRRRLEYAVRCVALAITAQQFSWSAKASGLPRGVTPQDLKEFERHMYLDGVERALVALRDARQSIALLAADGVEVGDCWRNDNAMQAQMEEVYATLSRRLLDLK
jgi:hypothetical protein